MLYQLIADLHIPSFDALKQELPNHMGTSRKERFEVAVGPHVYGGGAI
jgi:hypothetical protein